MSTPTEYTAQIAEVILERIASGESLRSVCRDDGMPSVPTVCRWVIEDSPPGFAEQYARARAMQTEALVDEIPALADDESKDPQRSRLQVDARKWVASKILPRKYGDKLDVTSAGERLPAPAGIDLAKLSADTLRRLAEELDGGGE